MTPDELLAVLHDAHQAIERWGGLHPVDARRGAHDSLVTAIEFAEAAVEADDDDFDACATGGLS